METIMNRPINDSILKVIKDTLEESKDIKILNIFVEDNDVYGIYLNSLENSGYIIRESTKTDGRIKIVKLTTKGEELRKNMKKLIEANEDKITSILSVEEKEMLEKTLKKIREKMEEE